MKGISLVQATTDAASRVGIFSKAVMMAVAALCSKVTGLVIWAGVVDCMGVTILDSVVLYRKVMASREGKARLV